MSEFKRATLALIVRRNYLLLGEKSVGEFGAGYLVGPGGKNLPGEDDFACLQREVREEASIAFKRAATKRVAELLSYRNGTPWFCVQVYRVWNFRYVRQKPEMQCDWHALSDLPISRMPPSDAFWVPQVLEGRLLRVTLEFDASGQRCTSHRVAPLET